MYICICIFRKRTSFIIINFLKTQDKRDNIILVTPSQSKLRYITISFAKIFFVANSNCFLIPIDLILIHRDINRSLT